VGAVVGVELTMDKSVLEQTFLFYVNAIGLPEPVREWRFHPVRRWRFDFAWPHPDVMVAVECEGGIWSRGRHVRGRGFEADCQKYNAAAVLGWKVLRVTGGMLDRDALGFLELLIEALGENDAREETSCP
jgi:very-short-patch-repair endonuclease